MDKLKTQAKLLSFITRETVKFNSKKQIFRIGILTENQLDYFAHLAKTITAKFGQSSVKLPERKKVTYYEETMLSIPLCECCKHPHGDLHDRLTHNEAIDKVIELNGGKNNG